MEKTLRKYFPLFVLPGLLCFAVAFLIPMVMGIVLSFCEFTSVTNAKWVGFSNYIRAFTIDNYFVSSLATTTAFAVISVITVNLLSFSLALMLTRGLRGTNVFRTLFFMPNLIGGIVLGWIWQVMINGVLAKYGATIVSSAKYGFWGMVILTNWQHLGYMMVIYIAALQNVSAEMLEAAAIDGAGYWQTLFRVVIPSIMPSITICLFMTMTGGFKAFDQNLALTAGEPARQTEFLALNIYNTFYGRAGFEGVGQAKAVVFTIIVATIALLQLKLTRSKEVEQ